MKTFKEQLLDKYGYIKPIIISKINAKEEYNISKEALVKRFNRLVDNNEIERYEKGIYYFPKFNKMLNDYVHLSTDKVITEKYKKSDNIIEGYETGIGLLNNLGLINQVPQIRLVVSNNTSKSFRGKNRVYPSLELIKTKININNNNYKYLQLFDCINKYWEYIQWGDDYAIEQFTLYLSDIRNKVSREEIIKCLEKYPAKVAIKFLDDRFEQLLPEI